jgi:hypothetical protein
MPSGISYRIDTTLLKKISKNTPERLSLWLDSVSELIVNDIKLSMGVSPSSPGDPPGVDTGALRASIHWYLESNLKRIISDGVNYGADLELGTENMAARPFVIPVFDKWKDKIGESAKQFGLIEP